jgi:hypothetical protein
MMKGLHFSRRAFGRDEKSIFPPVRVDVGLELLHRPQ